MGLGEGIARAERLAREGRSDYSAGVVLDVDDAQLPPLVLVNIGGGESWMPYVGARPWDGERVLVGYLGQKPVCMGAIYGHPLGTVVGSASGVHTVTGDDGITYRYPSRSGEPIAMSDRVSLDHAARTVLHTLSAEPPGSEFVPPPDPPPATPKAGGSGSTTFYPKWSAHYRGGSYQNNYVTISDTRSGFYGYGSQIAASIPDGATVTRMDLVLRQNWDQVPGVPSQMGTHSSSGGSAPGGTPGLAGSYTVPGGTRMVSLLGDVANALKTGAAFGVGFYAGAGYREYDHAGNSGQIIAQWE